MFFRKKDKWVRLFNGHHLRISDIKYVSEELTEFNGHWTLRINDMFFKYTIYEVAQNDIKKVLMALKEE